MRGKGGRVVVRSGITQTILNVVTINMRLLRMHTSLLPQNDICTWLAPSVSLLAKRHAKMFLLRAFVSVLVLAAIVACAPPAPKLQSDDRDSEWLFEMAQAAQCSTVRVPIFHDEAVLDYEDACILAAAAQKQIALGKLERYGIAKSDTLKMTRVSVSGGAAPSLAPGGGDDWAWWSVLVELTGFPSLLEVHFDRISHEITGGFCPECTPPLRRE